MALLPDDVLDELASETQVNRYSKKLQGQLMFKLLLYCILSYKDNSLRMMECAYESIGFKLLNAQLPNGSIHYSSISERLNAIDASYFEKLYKASVTIYSTSADESKKPAVTRFDSTIVSLSAELLKTGYHLKGGDADHVKQLKFTIGLSDIPVAAHLFTEPVYTSENKALKEAIFQFSATDADNTVKVFDKGINSRKTYDELTDEQICFVSRIETGSRSQETTSNKLFQPLETDTLFILSDSWQYLFSSNGKSRHAFRLIRAIRKDNGKELLFVSNLRTPDAVTVTQLYRKRWDIEAFFKFLKQELNFSHLVNRSENGVRVMLYVTMIASVLLLTYKKMNRLKGFKILKHKFINELEISLVKDFVFLCGGDANLIDFLLKPPL